jgi:hypothetical protein
MPSLKKTPSLPRKLSGKGDAAFLKDSIEFLFHIKGLQFQKKHHDFVPPCADEFFAYLEHLDPNVKKRTCLSNHFCAFIKFITPMEVDNHNCATILASFAIVLYALTLYTTATSYITKQPIDPEATAARNAFQECIYTHQPYVPKQAIEKIVTLSDEFVKQTRTILVKKLTIHGTETPNEIGQDICNVMDSLYAHDPFLLPWKAPIAILLTRCGVVPCRSMCEEVAEYIAGATGAPMAKS